MKNQDGFEKSEHVCPSVKKTKAQNLLHWTFDTQKDMVFSTSVQS